MKNKPVLLTKGDHFGRTFEYIKPKLTYLKETKIKTKDLETKVR